MRWLKDPLKPRHGERRSRRGFLFWPRCFDGEYRWLEFVTIVQEVRRIDNFGEMRRTVHVWHTVGWADAEA